MDLKVKLLREWIPTQEHLPQQFGHNLLLRYIDACKGDVEEAKKLIELSYTFRNRNPDQFFNRDPLDTKSQNALSNTQVIPLPNPSPDLYNVVLVRLGDGDADKYDYSESIKAFLMLEDVRLKTQYDEEYGIGKGEIVVFDMTGYGVRHVAKTSIWILKTFMKYLQEATCIRLKQIHIINCSSYISRILFLVRPFLSREMYAMIHCHNPDTDTLDEFFSKDLLPNEYGGKAGAVEEIRQSWIDRIVENRDYLMDNKNWKTDDSKRESSFRRFIWG